MSAQAAKLKLLQLQERNDMKGEQLADQRRRFAALAKQEVKAVSSFNLFQTPERLANRMADLLDPQPGAWYLEPSAGLGRLVRAVIQAEPKARVCQVENDTLAHGVLERQQRFGDFLIHMDFLGVKHPLRPYDGVIMNPPFKQGRDIKHIFHAYSMLKPGGRLVALCYNGVRQSAKLKPWGDQWIELPENTFAGEGTSADVCLIVKDKPNAAD